MGLMVLPQWKHKRTGHYVRCANIECHERVYVRPSDAKLHRAKYCCRTCAGAARRANDWSSRERKQDASQPAKRCAICGRTFRVRADQDPRWTLWCMPCREGEVAELSAGMHYIDRGHDAGADPWPYVVRS